MANTARAKTMTTETAVMMKFVRLKVMFHSLSCVCASRTESLNLVVFLFSFFCRAIFNVTFAPGFSVIFVPRIMDRIIGIDYGRKRTGVAVSDPLGIFASALETVHSAKIIEYLKSYCEKERVVTFVVGWPVNMDGTPSEAAADVNVFLKKLAAAFPEIPIETEDERFTSVLAHRAMIDGGMKASERRDKASVDRISAAIILQGWLDRRAGGTNFVVSNQFVPDSLSDKVTGKKRRRR